MNFPALDFSQAAGFAQAGLDRAAFFGATAFDCSERLTNLNLRTARSALENYTTAVSALAGAKDLQSFVALQQNLAAPAIEEGLDYSRSVYAITAEAKDKIVAAFEAQLAQTNAQLFALVEDGLRGAPAGSEVAVALVKSAIAAANNAFDNFNKVSRQVAEVAEAGVGAAAEASLKAATVAAPKGKKAA